MTIMHRSHPKTYIRQVVIMKKLKSAVAFATVSAVLLQGCGDKMTAQDYMQSAVSYYDQEDYGRARVQFRNALREDSGLAEAYYYLSLISEIKGETYVAYADIQRALELAPDNDKIRLKIAEYFVLTGQFAEAAEHVSSVLEVNPEHLDACKVMAASKIGLQNYEEALAVSERCKARDNELQALRIIALKFLERIDAASAEVAVLIDQAPQVQSYRLMALELAQLRGDHAASIDILKGLIALVPKDERPVFTLASLLSKAGQEQQAFDLLVRFNQANPTNKPVKRVLLEIAAKENLADIDKLLGEFLLQMPNDAGLQLLQVSQLLKGGRSGEAKELLEKLVAGESEDKEASVGAQLLLARLFALEGSWGDAITSINSLLAKDPYHLDALLLAGAAALNLRDGQAALNYAERILAREPEHKGAMHLKARASGVVGKLEEQRLWYEKLLAIDPDSLEARDFLVGDSMRQQQVGEAKRLLRYWPSASQGSGEYRMRQLQLAMVEKRWSAAREVLKSMIAAAPLGWRENLFEAQILAGEGRREEAIRAYQRLIEVQPGYVAAYDELAGLVDPKNQVSIIRWLEALIAKDLNNIPAAVVLVHLLERDGRGGEAVERLNKTLAQKPEWLQGYKLLAQVHYRQGDIDAALSSYDSGLRAVPDDAFLLVGKARLLEMAENYEGAANVYELLLAKQPNSPAIKNNYALLLVSHDDYRTSVRVSKAQSMVTEFASLSVPALQDTYAWVLYHTGDYRSAENILHIVNENMPNNPEVLFHFASALVAQKIPAKTEKAKQLIEQALSLVIDDKLREKLQLLAESI